MGFVGIGFSGNDDKYLEDFIKKNESWILGERNPRFFGNRFVILFDSNISRELIKKLIEDAPKNSITIFPMGKELKKD